jgi:exodeoxyribonuclease VII large subunit
MEQVTLDQWDAYEPEIFTVSAVSKIISGLLETDKLKNIWITGEITNYKRHSSGHIYFSLSEQCKGGEAVLRCTIWKSAARYLPFIPGDGMRIQAYGTIQNYQRSGQYTFNVTQIRPSGSGDKYLLVEEWKRELSSKGYFSVERKRRLPRYPLKIGVVTSETGAVFHDIKNVISSRFPVELLLSPTAVQGAGSERDIADAIARVQNLVDLIIVGRGGGSYEDLFAFNHPLVVEAIATAPVPVISAVGHESDITLADLAADVRASTPSHAAELGVPDRKIELESIREMNLLISKATIRKIEHADEELNSIRERLSPARMEREISERRQYGIELSDRMEFAGRTRVERMRLTLSELSMRIGSKNPKELLIREIPDRRGYLIELKERLRIRMNGNIASTRMELKGIRSLLEAHNPFEICRRGYCVVRKDGVVISSVSKLQTGEEVLLSFADGVASADITRVKCNEKI